MINLFFYVLCMALIFYAAVIYGNVGLFLLSFAGVCIIPPAYVYLLFLRFFLKTSLEIPVGVSECGKTAEITVKIKNKSFLPAPGIVFYLAYENLLTGERGRIKLKGVCDAWQTGSLCAEMFVNRCGKYRVCLKKIRIYGLSGIFYLSCKRGNDAWLYVMPGLYDTAVTVTEASRHFMGESDIYKDASGGPDASEILQIREFREGDKIQSIHWKMSAKADELMVRENRRPIGCPVVLFLDFAEKRQRADALLTVVAAVSFALLDQQCAHYITWYSGREQDVIRLRVDDEESFYLFLMLFYEEKKKEAGSFEIVEGYKEKYKAETYVTGIVFKPDLTVGIGENFQKTFTAEKLEQELREVEFIV